MADVIVTVKIMPSSVNVNLQHIKANAGKEIVAFKGRIVKEEIEPIAFGLKAIRITFTYDENKGGTDEIEAKINKIKGVESVDVVDVRRAIG